MNGSRVLLISKRPLFAEAVTRILKTANIIIVATVCCTEDAWSLLKSEKIINIIAEFGDPSVTEGDFISKIFQQSNAQRVILLDSDNNRMVVHRRESSDHITARDLIVALQDVPPILSASNFLN